MTLSETLPAGKVWGMRRLADRHGRFKMTAVDQRPPIKNPIREKRGTEEAPWEDVAGFKRLLIEELQGESSAMLLDPHGAYPRGISAYSPAKGLILTLEDSLFQETPGGRLSATIDDWSVEKIKRVGADAVKVLTWYRPDADPAVCRAQQDFTEKIGAACARYDIPFVFELLVYPLAGDSEQTGDYKEMRTKKPELVLESVATFADPRFGVDLFKLESPLAAGDVPGVGNDGWEDAQAWFDKLGATAGRPWVMLSAGAGMEAFEKVLTHAYAAGASGYLAGRAIWLEAFRHFPDWDAIRNALRDDAVDYMRDINRLTDTEALPWHRHSCYGGTVDVAPADQTFRHHYSGFGG
ncbi:tagatose 1,6-diphosphate aldolase [Exilibacterium tricleocarpae]|uniref:Tagatose 1,6-diphosphate aldolase n=1 Tax=Exilibacterium tricleocarpae TaxID=2591008 RepID=A0A545SRY6_9GAMM|nr:tagatose 1,6-diphosphate aldolase [Exilibacterium tricleocarpae]TQV67734.1 tagatose 1,6-diphosphate aldolase [Exilibacterium tricleocarpae]